MINDVGKTSVIIRLNDYVINMVNANITSNIVAGTGLDIYSEDNSTLRYRMSVNQDALNSRCLMYTRSFSGDTIGSTLRPVLYVPPVVLDTQTGGVTCIPLYECISPSCSRLINGNYQLTWWSNMDAMPTTDAYGKYKYDYTKIHRFNTMTLGDVESTASACKILCTAPVHWEKLRMDGFDDRPYNTPIIRDIAILAAISGEGYIVDFATGGGNGGGGLRIHNHLSNQECGFAGAVFMPSAIPRPMSWR